MNIDIYDPECPWIVKAAHQDISKLTAEILRISRLPYSSRKNFEKIRKIDDQIMYLEQVLASFERDRKKFS